MRRTFTMVLMMLVAMAAQAQYLLQENFDAETMPAGWSFLDHDGDGYDWVFSPVFDGVIWGHNGSAGCMLSQSYDRDLQRVLHPDNFLVTPPITIANATLLTYWVCAQDATYPAEHYAVYVATEPTAAAFLAHEPLLEETLDAAGGPRTEGVWKQKTVNLSAFIGQTVYVAFRHFNCSDEFYLKIDDVEISEGPFDPTIAPNESALAFGMVEMNDRKVLENMVHGLSLSGEITATTTAPFAVSADGVNFTTTATLPTVGGMLYVQYAPTSEGEHTGTVTLSASDVDDATINLSGNSLDCSGFPILEDFETGHAPCWTVVANGNEQNRPYIASWPGELFFMFFSAFPSNDYNQYLISPRIVYGDRDMEFALDYKCHEAYDESFRMGYSTTTKDLDAFTWISDVTSSNSESWTHHSVVVPQGTKYVAVHYYSDMLALYVDNLSVSPATGVEIPEEVEMTVFPNPASNMLNVVADGYRSVEVSNVLGQVVFRSDMNGSTRIDVGGWDNGFYFLRVHGEKGTLTRKFVKR